MGKASRSSGASDLSQGYIYWKGYPGATNSDAEGPRRPFVEPIILIITKFEEAERHLDRVSSASDLDDFYDFINTFLPTAHAVLNLIAFHFGWSQLKKKEKAAITDAQQQIDRRRFDKWAVSNISYQAILDHPLTNERHEIIHKSGQSTFIYYPQQGRGLAIEPGTRFTAARMTRGLPLTTEGSKFMYRLSDGREVNAIEICRQYLDLIWRIVGEVKQHSW